MIIQNRIILLFFASIFILQIKSQEQKYKGYPSKSEDIDVVGEFKCPPKGYGNVPFYWWNGDSLNTERLKDQLDVLSSAAIDGFAVSYIHQDPDVDVEAHKNGFGLFGKTEPGKPQVFSEKWWQVWKWFTQECAKKSIGVGLDDYTIGWIGNGYYPDKLVEEPKFKNYRGKLEIEVIPVKEDSILNCKIPSNILALVAYPGKIDLSEYINEDRLIWKAPNGKPSKVYIITTSNSYVLHPDYGKELVDVYFANFEKKVGDAAKGGMNYFFQDELSYPIEIGSWSEDFRNEFEKRKGYDILLYLPALKDNIGDITPKIRIDYCEVLMDLAENRYFKPIYNWHAERGLIYGCDNLDRGMDPLAYVDYFRANSWYTAPGNDAPARGSSFMSTKVSSSIAHLNKRPRTWLEAFHSMGWGSSGAWLTRQIDHHFMAGGNLLCMHGLYYSTHGGWWEWAPPCFHFRMPYWPHMKKWLEYTQRLSYLMSQGHHVCDIALIYPTESMQAYSNSTPKRVFNLAQKMSDTGLDYDFVNYSSLQKAVVEKQSIRIADEKYKVIILADMPAIHHSSLLKILEHYRAGGIVLATGELPKASTLSGENDREVDSIVKEIFGLTSAEVHEGKTAGKQTNPANGIGLYLPDMESLDSVVESLIVPDFKPNGKIGKVLHRRVGDRDIYMVMDVPKNTECFFRATGKVELWDAHTGNMQDYPVVRQTKNGTYLFLEKEPENSYLFVFSHGKPLLADKVQNKEQLVSEILLDGKWEVELLPTMNNKWGDFRLPASNELIGAEARSFRNSPATNTKTDWIEPDFDDSGWAEDIYGYGPQAFLDTISNNISITDAILLTNEKEGVAYNFSWQYGVWDNPGSQGMHGLKGKVDDRFFILNSGSHQFYKTQVYVPYNGVYKIQVDGIRPNEILIDKKKTDERPMLTKGWHKILIVYADTKRINYKMETGALHDFRDRGAVVLFLDSAILPTRESSYSSSVSMRWLNTKHLVYDPYGGKYKRWNYRFRSVPGLYEMEFKVAGHDLKVWFDGIAIPKKNVQLLGQEGQGNNIYKVTLPHIQKDVGTVAFSVEREIGYQGTAVLSEPVKLRTEKGFLKTGDWSETGALKYYSGGMYYRNEFSIDSLYDNMKVVLDLTNVVATCEVKINDRSAGILMSPPYQVDITPYLLPRINKVEILVYSTLANHYQTIPTPYRCTPEAGLIGPVKVAIYNR